MHHPPQGKRSSGLRVPNTLVRHGVHTEPDSWTDTGSPPRVSLKQRLWLGDLVAATLAWSSVLVVYPAWESARPIRTDRVGWTAAAIVTTLALLALQNLYWARVCNIRTVELQGIGRSALGTAVVLVVIEQVLRANLPLREVWLAGFVAFATIALQRTAFTAWLRHNRAAGRFVRDLVMVGADADAVELAAVMRDHPELGFRTCGYVGEPGRDHLIEAPHLGGVAHVLQAVERTRASGVVVIASALGSDTLNATVRRLLRHGVRVHLSSGLRGIAHQRFRATPLAYEPLFYIEPASLAPWQAVCKRAMDIAGATVGLLLTAPVLATAAAAIKATSPGPVFFTQQRVGRDGDLFTFYKLRSMVHGAESQRARLQAQNQRASGPLFKLASDPRVTRVGRLLRATSIDELPQLWNVLRGSMSLVGPRPALPSEVASFDEQLRTRVSVSPGLTGLWQIEARDNPAFGPYRRLDLFYVENWSPLLDLGILVTTVGRVVGRALRIGRSTDDADTQTTIVLD